MKTMVTTFIAVSVLAATVVPENANARDKHRKRYVAPKRAYTPPANADNDGYGPNRQVSYDINTLPFGSKLWWEQYLRTSGGASGADGGGQGGP